MPILNISEHLTRLRLQTKARIPFGTYDVSQLEFTAVNNRYAVLGALLGTQNGRDVEIVNSFELAVEADGLTVDQGFLVARKEQCAQA